MSHRLSSIVAVIAVVVVAGSVWCAAPAHARSAKVEALDAPISPHDPVWVPVRLDRYANHHLPVDLPGRYLKVNGVPFELMATPERNNLFLDKAGWRNWEKDPSSYYSPYDYYPDTAPAKLFSADDMKRYMVSAPVDDYTEVAVLGYAEDDQAYTDVMSLRIGAFDGPRRVTVRDFRFTVPRAAEAGKQLAVADRLFLLRFPLPLAAAQDFAGCRALDIDITKELRLVVRRPDPCRFQIRPLGLPSGVHLFAMTLKRAPVSLWVEGLEPGNVFNEPQVPTFRVTLRRSEGSRGGTFTIAAVATDAYGNVTEATSDKIPFRGSAEQSDTIELPIPVKHRGYHELVIRLMVGRQVLVEKQTTFALLPPDTRKFRNDSPMGTWDFCGGHYTPNDPDLLGPLYVKAGLRYGMVSRDDAIRRRYGVERFNDPKPKPENLRKMAEEIRATPGQKPPPRVMIFHETAVSGSHIMRQPTALSGQPYKFDEKEQKKFDQLWQDAEETARTIREVFPQAEIYFGNGNPMLVEEFLRRKFPPELLGSRGNEAGNFMRPPETQPPDWIANGAGLWVDRLMLDHYGYNNTPLRQCYEMCYPSTNPGNLSLWTQAHYYIRHTMHSMAWRIPIIRSLIITDTGNSYYFSNWGSAGLCFGLPSVSPKPAYVACATLTQVLDGMTHSRTLPTGSPVVYAMEFVPVKGNRERKVVTCVWTTRGTRPMRVPPAGRQTLTLTDLMGTETTLTPSNGVIEVSVSEAPVFLTSAAPLGELALGAPVYGDRPDGERQVLSPLASPDEWQVDEKPDPELMMYDFMRPRRPGHFAYAPVAAFEGETNVLSVTPRLPVEGSQYFPMYSVLQHKQGIEVPGEPTEIGLLVNGNGGWGRLIFELEDAAGARWISIGAEQKGEPTRWMADWLSEQEIAEVKGGNLADWNTDDAWGNSYINFEGWRYLRVPLPGNYPGVERFHWPRSSQWRTSGDGIVHYPLKLTRLIITMPEKALHLTEYRPVPRPEIYLKDLSVTYRPPEEAFGAE